MNCRRIEQNKRSVAFGILLIVLTVISVCFFYVPIKYYIEDILLCVQPTTDNNTLLINYYPPRIIKGDSFFVLISNKPPVSENDNLTIVIAGIDKQPDPIPIKKYIKEEDIIRILIKKPNITNNTENITLCLSSPQENNYFQDKVTVIPNIEDINNYFATITSIIIAVLSIWIGLNTKSDTKSNLHKYWLFAATGVALLALIAFLTVNSPNFNKTPYLPSPYFIAVGLLITSITMICITVLFSFLKTGYELLSSKKEKDCTTYFDNPCFRLFYAIFIPIFVLALAFFFISLFAHLSWQFLCIIIIVLAIVFITGSIISCRKGKSCHSTIDTSQDEASSSSYCE